MIRINKYIADSGLCSRRKAEEFIKDGRVSINGKIVKDLSTKVEEIDKVTVDGKKITNNNEKIYIMLNKPRGYITTNDEQFDRKCTKDLIKEKVRVFPIGRLDMDTEGLLLLTNDGEFANKLMHPKNRIEKKYIVSYEGNISTEQIEKLKSGVDIGGYITKPAKVNKINEKEFGIIISEGKNRQVRKMCEAVNIKLVNLKRIQIGGLEIGNLQVGKYRYLNKNDLKKIYNIK